MSHSPRKTCGSDLSDRVSRICLPRGGYQRHPNHSRSKRSIVSECCWNVCPDANIYYYCSNENVMDDSDSTTAYYENEQDQHSNDKLEDIAMVESSTISTNLKISNSRQYSTISPEFRKGIIYVRIG